MRYLTTNLILSLLLLTINVQAQETVIHDVEHYLHYSYEAALVELDNNVASNPVSPIHLIKRAKFLQMHGQTAEAAEDLKLATFLSPLLVDLYYHTTLQNRKKLISLDLEETFVDPDFRHSLQHYANRLESGYSANELRSVDVIELHEIIDHAIFGHLQLAISLLDEHLERLPYSFFAYDLKGIIYTETGEFDLAEQSLQTASSIIGSDPNIWYNISKLRSKQGQIEAAHEALDSAISLDETFVLAHLKRAFLHRQNRDYQAAITAYDQALNIEEEGWDEALINRSLLKKIIGDYDGALSDISMAIEANPNLPSLYKHRANLHLLHDRPTEALRDYDQALRINPEYAEAIHNRGIAHLLLHDFEAGCLDIRTSASLGHEPGVDKQKYFCHLNPR